MNNQYYQEMLKNERLMPFFEGDRCVCFMTFYIDFETDKFSQRDDQWQLVKDDENGDICYIDHLLTDKSKENHKVGYRIFKKFQEFIKSRYPKVKKIRYYRWNKKTNKLKKFEKILTKEQ